MNCIKKNSRWVVLAGFVALSACAGNEPILDSSSSGASQSSDSGPSGTITRLSEVKVTPAQNKMVQFRGSASKAFTYDHLQAVLYCRAWQYARANGLAGGYPLRFHKLEGANADSALVAITSVQMYEGANPSGKSSINQAWCAKVPRAAK